MIEISVKEWKMVAWLSLAVIIITTIPIAVGFIAQPAGKIFTGFQTTNTTDTPVYYSWIEQARNGHFLFSNLFTPEEEPRFIFDPFWLAVGFLAKISSLSGFLAYQLARFFLIPVFLAVAYTFISYFFQDIGRRKMCLFFLVFASGLGGLVWLTVNLLEPLIWDIWLAPMDLWVAESTTFFPLYHSPHFTASLTCTISIFLLMLLSFDQKKIIYSVAAGFVALFLFTFHPYHVPTIIGVLGIYLLVQSIYDKKIRWDIVKHSSVAGVIASPAVLYHFWILSAFWTRQQHALQNNLITPGLINFALSYGLILIFSFFGIAAITLKKNKDGKDLFLLVWWTAQLVFPYLPIFNFQRKLLEGTHFVLVITAIVGLALLKKLIEERLGRGKIFTNPIALIIIFSVSLGLTNYTIIARDTHSYLGQLSLSYLTREKYEAMAWFRENTPENSVIFSTYANGNLIPAFGLRKVYLGHWGMTADAKTKEIWVNLFFTKYGREQQGYFLKTNLIDYLFYGPEEKKFKKFTPDQANYLEKVYQNNEVEIYKVLEN